MQWHTCIIRTYLAISYTVGVPRWLALQLKAQRRYSGSAIET